MSRHALILGLLLLLAAPVTRVEAIDIQDLSGLPAGNLEIQDKSKEIACECCQKCKSAQRPTKPQEEEGHDVKDGCEDCCKRCGGAVPLTPDEIPPEIINKPKL